ncbi:hypothetical protein GCM10010470_65320 [Saccharopolyspora taberi]|uniref:Uncharacterized protein n=1 Tax=Saccharopolyspora taberi TaxID=60895 RepID=A0ABN3VN10_9PSEU
MPCACTSGSEDAVALAVRGWSLGGTSGARWLRNLFPTYVQYDGKSCPRQRTPENPRVVALLRWAKRLAPLEDDGWVAESPGQPRAGRPMAASTAMATNSSARYEFDRWNSFIGL